MDTNLAQARGIVIDAGGDTYEGNVSVGITEYVDLGLYIIKFTTANGGASTLNLQGVGAKDMVTNKLTALSANDIKAGSMHFVIFDQTADMFQIISIHV